MEESVVVAAIEEPLDDVVVDEPSMGDARDEPSVNPAMEEPSVDAATEEAMVGAAMEEPSAKKLLVLDVNGLLVATYHKAQKTPGEKHHAKLGNFYVYERPGCREFLDFCFKHFVVGVWSSAREHNVNLLVNYIFKDLKDGLSFSWHQRHCTTTAVMHPDNKRKPIFLKELSKLWVEVEPGRFDQSNTLLIDDSPYKALKNPAHTAIFPQTYNGDEVDDNFLTVLRTYLGGVRDATDVQEYVSNNKIGEPGISPESPLWGYFSSILNAGSQELNSTATEKVINGVTLAVASEPNPEEIELEDMDQPLKRRRLSPVGVAGHSSRNTVHASQDMVREREDVTAEDIHWRRSTGNGHELENVKTKSHRNFERERERSPRMHTSHREDRKRFATNHERESSEFVGTSKIRSSYVGDYNTRRDVKPRESWHDHSRVRDTFRNREPLGRRSSEYDIKRTVSLPGGRQFMTSEIDIRDPPPPPVFSAHESIRTLLPPPVLPARSWDHPEWPTLNFDNFGGGRHVTNVPLSTPTELDRSWRKPEIPGRGREYNRKWEEPVDSGLERGYDGGWVRPTNSAQGSEYDRRWETSLSAARGSEYGTRWKHPMGSERGSEYDRRWKEPVSAGRERGYDSVWDRPASISHGKEYDSRWGAPLVNTNRGREYDTSWDEPAHSDYRKDYDRRWEQPVSSGHTRKYESKWSSAPLFQYAPPGVEHSSQGYSRQGYNNPSIDYEGRYPPADRNVAGGPRDNNRPSHWGASNNYHR